MPSTCRARASGSTGPRASRRPSTGRRRATPAPAAWPPQPSSTTWTSTDAPTRHDPQTRLARHARRRAPEAPADHHRADGRGAPRPGRGRSPAERARGGRRRGDVARDGRGGGDPLRGGAGPAGDRGVGGRGRRQGQSCGARTRNDPRADGHLADLRGVPDPLRPEWAAAGAGKKRLCALAAWVWGGGANYCRACDGPCPDCPQTQERPLTVEGRQVRDLVQAADGQLRLAPMGGVIGFDMTALLAMARARGVPLAAAAELLPHIEAVVVETLQKRNDEARAAGSAMGAE